jgi:ferredoxin
VRNSPGRRFSTWQGDYRATGWLAAYVKVQIDSGRCQGHGRCYDIDPGSFGDDVEGYGKVVGEGLVPPGQERAARLAAASCPERAIILAEEA